MGKILSWMLLLAVALVFVAGPAMAQDQPPKKQHSHLSPEDQFKKWDANNDGKVTLDEMKAAMTGKEDVAEKMFKHIAGDKDSFTLDDYKAFREKHKGGKKAPPADKPADK